MKIRLVILAISLFVFGAAVGYGAKKAETSAYRSKSKQEAGRALLEIAKAQAGKGSWERIAVGRVYYLGGMKPEGQAIFDDIMKKKPESSDLFRIARVYREAGEWNKAKPLFDQYVQKTPKDDKGLAEVGAYYMLNGDRATAEDLFDRSFKLESELWSTVSAAASYLDVTPQE